MPDISTYLSNKDYERLKLRCYLRRITPYRYVQDAILHALDQIEKHGVEWLSEDAVKPKKKKEKSWMARMPIIELDS